MSIGFGRSASQHLTHAGLAVTPRRGGRRRLLGSVLILASLAAGLGVGWAMRDRVAAAAPPAPTSTAEIGALRQQLEQARLGMRLAEARSHELEHQIDALNQHLSESQDELAFLRAARGSKH